MFLAEYLTKALAELDARRAPDAEYREMFSTGSKQRLRRGETWRNRLVAWQAQAEKFETNRV